MAVDWDMAAVAAALWVFAAPIAWTTVVGVVSTLQKMNRNVVRLKWGDIPDGKLHDCGSYYYHGGPHTAQKRCWESAQGLTKVCNRTWELFKRRPQFAEHVSGDLPSSDYICTDARTVLAFVLVTAPERKALEWYPGAYGSSKLTCVSWKGITVCHAQGSPQEIRDGLNKHEVDCMLNGYPPWYRDTFVTYGNISLPFPISGLSDVSRGGWIVAVGLMETMYMESQKPLALYRCQDEPREPEWRSNGVVYRNAIERCLEHITRNIQSHFPDDANVKGAVTNLEYLLREKTGSGAPWLNRCMPGNSGRIPHLRSSDCKFLMKNFNDFRALDVQSGEDRKMGSILLPAMAAVVNGSIDVVQYLKDIGVEFKFPEELTDFDQVVYLKDCDSRLPYD